MTDNQTLPPPLPPARPVRHLHRAVIGKRWLGVARGVAEYTGAPVSAVRLAFFLASFAGGLGLFAYLVAALLIPKMGEVNTLGDRVSGGRPDRLLAIIAASAVGVWAFFNGGSFDILAVAALGGAGYYLWTKDRTAGPPASLTAPTAAGWPQPQSPSKTSTSSMTSAVQDAPDWQTWKPDVDMNDGLGYSMVPPPRTPVVFAKKRKWGWASLAASIGLMVVAAPFLNLFQTLMVGFLVLLVGFVSGLLGRRASWGLLLPLFALFVLLFPASWFVSAGVPLSTESGELILVANDVNNGPTERRLAAGHIKVDLRGVTANTLKYSIGTGQIEILVPENVGYTLQSDVGAGAVNLGDQTWGGNKVEVDRTSKPEGAIRSIELDLKVGIGDISIIRTAPETATR